MSPIDGIQKDAGVLLAYFYDIYRKGAQPDAVQIRDQLKWDTLRLSTAASYLRDLGAIKTLPTYAPYGSMNPFRFSKLLPLGIDIIEDKKKFKRQFGVAIDLGVLQLCWSTSDK